MVFREETVLQVRSLVAEMEKPPEMVPGIERKDSLTLGTHQHSKEPQLSTGKHVGSCLANNLFHSVYKCRMKKVKFLLDNGLNINTRNDYGYSVLVAALHIENAGNRSKMFRFLLDKDSDPMHRDPKYGRNVLSWASVLGRTEQVILLLETQMGEFDLHEKDRDGMTPLHLATQSGHTDIVKALVNEMTRYGKTVDVPDNLGLTPYLHAKRLGYGYIADILKDEGNASVGQADMYSFKKADEWRDIGIKERNRIARQRRDSQYEQAAISGSTRLLGLFEQRGFEVIDLDSEVFHRRDKPQTVENPKGIKTVRVMSPRSQYSLPEPLIRKTPRDTRIIDDTRPHMVSLIQLSPSRKGQVPKHFRPSQVDTTKASHYRTILSDLATMMEYLSQQQTKSFRKAVPPLNPVSVSEKKDKKSTLAIIFGRKGKKSIRAQGSGSKKYSGSVKGRRGSKASR